VIEAATEAVVAVEQAEEVALAEVATAAEEEAAAGGKPHLISLIQTIQRRA